MRMLSFPGGRRMGWGQKRSPLEPWSINVSQAAGTLAKQHFRFPREQPAPANTAWQQCWWSQVHWPAHITFCWRHTGARPGFPWCHKWQQALPQKPCGQEVRCCPQSTGWAGPKKYTHPHQGVTAMKDEAYFSFISCALLFQTPTKSLAHKQLLLLTCLNLPGKMNNQVFPWWWWRIKKKNRTY